MFRNREDGAKQLAAVLRDLQFHRPLVLGIPRGGIVTGAVLAEELGAELDVVLSRKLRAPGQPELAIGAIAENGHTYLNHRIAESLGVSNDYLDEEKEYQLAEIHRRKCLFRNARPEASIVGRSVILTDDGIATGSTMMAAIETIRPQHPSELIVAVPVAPPHQIAALEQRCDRVICLRAPEEFRAVGQFYDYFPTVEDEDVVQILRNAAPLTEPGFVV